MEMSESAPYNAPQLEESEPLSNTQPEKPDSCSVSAGLLHSHMTFSNKTLMMFNSIIHSHHIFEQIFTD